MAKTCNDTKHLKNTNLGNSTNAFPDPKSVSRGLQSPQTSGSVPSNSKGALQHGTSILSCRRPLDGDSSARVVEVLFHTDCTCGARRQNYDLIDEMPRRPRSGDPSVSHQSRTGDAGENTQLATRAVTSPQFCNHRKLISGF